ncbi:MAG: Uma2 family endonuclease, partial [Anaerolineae bacterium]|nr:Uma2 family endonuclease [Anaerolineae bacterium]
MVLETIQQAVTLAQFRETTLLPENAERTFELLNGEIIEKMPGTTRNSAIAVNIAFEVRLFCREKSLP